MKISGCGGVRLRSNQSDTGSHDLRPPLHQKSFFAKNGLEIRMLDVNKGSFFTIQSISQDQRGYLSHTADLFAIVFLIRYTFYPQAFRTSIVAVGPDRRLLRQVHRLSNLSHQIPPF